MGFAFSAKWLGVGIETAKGPDEVGWRDAQMALPPGAERRCVRRLLGTKAAVAATVVGRREHRIPPASPAQTRRAARHHDAHCTPPLAFEAHTVRWGVRLAPVQKGTDDLEELCLLIGQPRSSKSTRTWLAMGVDVASVSMYAGVA